MKITPIEIRQHTFEKGLRGYKSEDVDAFLASLSQEWERLTSDYKMMKMQLELAEKELNKLKEVEMTLFRTLKTAEDTSAQITDQANKAGENYINEAKQKADEIVADARKRTTLMVQDAENQARYLKDNILNDLKSLEHDFKALEGYKENLAIQIRTLAGNAVDSVERFEKKFHKQNLKGKIDEVSAQITEDLKQADQKKETPAEATTDITPESKAGEVADLPPLIIREQSIPDALPEDSALVDKAADAVQATQAQDESVPDRINPDSIVAELNTSELVNQSSEESQPKKGGSFFDQI